MNHICKTTGAEFVVSDDDLEFYKRMNVPPPSLSPEERLRRRLNFRNFKNLQYRNCSVTGKRVLSMYRDDVAFPVYDNDYWWSDKWDPLDYGRDFDFSRPFFEQYLEFSNSVPRYTIMNINCENCQFSNIATESRDSYLVFGCIRSERCLYGHIVWDSEQCIDCLYVFRCQWCSNSIDLADCYGVHYSSECTNCTDSYFLHDCRNCQDCFGCTNLRGKQYCFLNEQLSKEAYEERLAGIKPFSQKTVADGLTWLDIQKRETAIYPVMFGVKNEDVVGNHCYECKDLWCCFDVKQSESCKYVYTVFGTEHSYDISFNGRGGSTYCYECLTVGGSNDIVTSQQVMDCSNVSYSEFCFSSHNIFGCNGVRNKKYCILNKQYSEEEYSTLVPKIIEHMKQTEEWGEFFPAWVSPFAYNEAIVNEYLPLNEAQAKARNLAWLDKQEEIKQPQLVGQIPDNIAAAEDSMLDQVFICEQTGKPYKIIKAELDISRRLGIPLPKVCPDTRHLNRMRQRGPRELYQAKCAKTGEDIISAIDPSQVAAVYSEEAYMAELY